MWRKLGGYARCGGEGVPVEPAERQRRREQVERVLRQDSHTEWQAIRDPVIAAWRREHGTPIDDTTDRLSVIDADGWETEAETQRRVRRETLIEASRDEVRRYADAHPESYAGSWLAWSSLAPTLVVAFTRDLHAHRARLSAEGVRVVRRPRPLSLLAAVAGALIDERLPRDAERVHIEVDEQANVVEIEAIGTDEPATRDWLHQHYGDAVRLIWLGPDELLVQAIPWQVWEPTEPGGLVVYVADGGEVAPARTQVTETATAITVTVFEEVSKRRMSTVDPALATVTLGSRIPVGTRSVIDGATGRTRAPYDANQAAQPD